jgi:uncharacterized RDD family membrane protein YckC
VGVAVAAGQALLRGLGDPIGSDLSPWTRHAWTSATVTAPVLLYFALTVTTLGGAPGQRLLKLSVSRAAEPDRRLPFGRSLLRAAVLLAPLELILTAVLHDRGLGLLGAYVLLALLVFSIVLQREGRGLHDLVSGARVVSGGA